jgi:hypothetical protein
MIRERARRRERVLDWRQLFDFRRRAGPVAVVEILAEEVLVVRVVPAVGALDVGFVFGRLLLGRLRFGGLLLFDRLLLEHRVLDHLVVQQILQLERRHWQQLDRLLQRWRQNQLLNEFGVKFLRNRHGP